jgi:hypothetical protein
MTYIILILEHPLQEFECFRRHDDVRRKMDLRWLAGNLDSDSEALEPARLWLDNESRHKRIRLRTVY